MLLMYASLARLSEERRKWLESAMDTTKVFEIEAERKHDTFSQSDLLQAAARGAPQRVQSRCRSQHARDIMGEAHAQVQ